MITVTEHTLKNGLRVIFVRRPMIHVIHMEHLFAHGSVDETPENNGVTHVLEHMLFKGTRDFPTANNISRAIDAIGCDYNAFTSKEVMTAFIRSHPSTYKKAIHILSEVLFRPLFRSEDLELEKRVIIEELRNREDNPDLQFSEYCSAQFFPGLPEGLPTGGNLEYVKKIKAADIKRRYEQVCHCENQIFVAAGDFDEQAMLNELNLRMGKFILKNSHDHSPRNLQLLPPSFGNMIHPNKQATLSFIFRCFAENDWRWSQLRILADIFSQRLYQRIREKHALVYWVGADASSMQHHGTFSISCKLDPVNIPALLKDITTELKLILHKPVKDIELENAKRLSRFNIDYAKDVADQLASWYAWQRLCDPVKKLKMPEDSDATIRHTTKDDLRKLAKQILRRNNLSCFVMSPVKISSKSLAQGIKFN